MWILYPTRITTSSGTVVQTDRCGNFDDYPNRLVFLRLLSNFLWLFRIRNSALVAELTEQDVSLVPTFRCYKSVSKRIRNATYLELCDKSVLSFGRWVM